jgi:hypothetical protein
VSDLIAYSAADERPDGFVHMTPEELSIHVAKCKVGPGKYFSRYHSIYFESSSLQ